MTATLTGEWDVLADGSLLAELDAMLEEGYRNAWSLRRRPYAGR